MKQRALPAGGGVPASPRDSVKATVNFDLNSGAQLYQALYGSLRRLALQDLGARQVPARR